MSEDRTQKKVPGVADQSLEREFEALLRRVSRDGLLHRIAGLDLQLKTTSRWPGKLRDASIQRALTTVAAYEESLAENPFHQAPPDRINGPLSISDQKRDGSSVGIEPIELCSNFGVLGSTGSGKTAFVEHFLAGLDVVSPSTQQCFYDPKGSDWLARAVRHVDTIIVDEELPLSILIPPEFMSKEAYHPLFARTFCDAYYGGFHMYHVLTEALRDAFAQHPNGPSMMQFHDSIQHLGGKDRTYQLRDAQLNAGTRVLDVCTVFPGIATAVPPRCHTMQTLCNRPVHFSSRSRLHAYEFLFSLWVQVRHAYHLAMGIKNSLHTFIVADEALQILEANSRHITGEPLLTHTIGMTREAGIGWGVTLSSWRSVSPVVRANMNHLAVLRVTDGAESEELRRTLRLTPAQHEYLDHHLNHGEVILDELASLQRLPQLPTAITEARKANLRLVLGFQGRTQLEARYGLESETMLSQPTTKIFLRTSEPRAAKWISETIGNVEIERLKESRTEPMSRFFDGWRRKSKTYHLDRRVEPLVMDSVIQGLPNLSGYLKSQDLVVPVAFPWVPPERKQRGFIPRPIDGNTPPQNVAAQLPNRPQPTAEKVQEREGSPQHSIFD